VFLKELLKTQKKLTSHNNKSDAARFSTVGVSAKQKNFKW